MIVAYWISLVVIVGLAAAATLSKHVDTGVIGGFFLGGAAMFALAGLESDPPNWLVGLVGCIAMAGLWAAVTWMRRPR